MYILFIVFYTPCLVQKSNVIHLYSHYRNINVYMPNSFGIFNAREIKNIVRCINETIQCKHTNAETVL